MLFGAELKVWMMATDSIFNFIKIDDHIATSGQPTEAQLIDARDEGYEAVINLAPIGKTDPRLPQVADEAGILAGLGMDYRYIPVEWTNPRREDFNAFSSAMEQLRDSKVLIHCAANFRVTAFFSLYAMKKLGWSREQADGLMARAWKIYPDYEPDEIWKGFIESVRSQ